MAHFAKVENNQVVQVIVVSNDDCSGGDFPQSEPIGQAFISSLGLTGLWLQTSYSGSFRNCFAGIGYLWNETTQEFELPPIPETLKNEF